MLRKPFSSLLVTVLTLSLLAGCSSSGNESVTAESPQEQTSAASEGSTGSSAETGDSARISILWHGGLNQTNKIREMVETEFKQMHPEITVEFTEVPSTDIANKAMMEVTGKTGAYDLAMQYLTVPALVNAGGVEPLDEYIARDNFEIDKFIDIGFRYQGKVQALPLRADVRVLHYNQQHFIDAGLDPEKPPTTREEFDAYAKTLTREGLFGDTRRPLSADNFTSLLFEFGGELVDDQGEPVFNSAIGVQVINYMLEELASGVLDPMSTGWQHSDEMSAYMSGGSAMFDAWPARYIDARMPEKSTIVGQSRAAAVPGEYVLCGGWNFVMLNTCKNKDAAWELMKFIADPVTQKEVIKRGGDCNPTHLDVLFDEELQGEYEVLKAIGDVFDHTRSYPVSTQNSTLVTILETYLPMAVLDGMDPQTTLDQAVADYREALVDAGELS